MAPGPARSSVATRSMRDVAVAVERGAGMRREIGEANSVGRGVRRHRGDDGHAAADGGQGAATCRRAP